MSTAEERDRIFFDVPLSEEALDQLYAIAEADKTEPVHILRRIVENYQRNGTPPGLQDEKLSGVYRGVPLSHAFLRDIKELAAEHRKSPIAVLKAIVEEALQKRAAKLPVTTG